MAKVQYLKLSFFVILLMLCVSAAAAPQVEVSPDDVIIEVNALRANLGLEPYQVDPWLMSYAQEHAHYMAEIGHGTHQHSDGSMPSDNGLRENAASGSIGYLSAYFVVNVIWADEIHMKTMTHPTGYMGVGVASNGVDEYVSLDVRPGDSTGPILGGSQAQDETPIPIEPFQVCTPQPDGSVIHTIGYGQTLWSISQGYGIPMQQLLDYNGFEDETAPIYAGQRLLIKVAPLSSATSVQIPTETASVVPSISPTTTLTSVAPITQISMTPTPSSNTGDNDTSAFSRALLLTGAILGVLFFMYLILYRKPNR